MISQARTTKQAIVARSLTGVMVSFAAGVSQIGLAHAEVTFVPYATVKYEHYSNLYAVPSDAPVKAADGQPTLDDAVLFYIAGAEADYTVGRQKLYAIAEGRRLKYSNFSQLDHDEYKWNGGLEWALTRLVDGKFAYEKERRQVAFTDDQSQSKEKLNLETEENLIGEVNLNVSRNWRIEFGLQNNNLDSPQIGRPNFGLRENINKVGIKYLGVTNLSAGFEGIYADIDYLGLSNDEAQKIYGTTGQFTADYKVGGRTSFNAALGYSSRDAVKLDGKSTINTVVGGIGYNRKLTGKTSLDLQLSRVANDNIYNAGATTEVGTGAIISLIWQATPRANFTANYSMGRSKFRGDGLNFVVAQRSDRTQSVQLTNEFKITEWLVLSPFGRYEERQSNFQQFSYDNTIYGVELRVRFE